MTTLAPTDETTHHVTFICARCGGSGPVSDLHRCPPLTGRQLRRAKAADRLRRIVAADSQTWECADCGGTIGRREVHACPGRSDLATAVEQANVAGLVQTLRRHGYVIKRNPAE